MRNAPVVTWSALFVLSAIGACVVWTRDEAPENERPFALLPIGYPAPDCEVPDLTRKPLDQVMVAI